MFQTGLRTKFILGIFGIIVLLGAVMIFFIKTSLRDTLMATLQERGLTSAMHVAGIAENPVLMEQFFQLELLLRNTKALENDIRYIFLVDPEGKVLADTFDRGVPMGLKEANLEIPKNGFSIKRLLTEEEEILDIAVPLLEGALGMVRLGVSGESVKKEVDGIIDLIVIMTVAALLMGGGVMAAIFDVMITKPIIALGEVARAVGRGDLERRVDLPRSSDEVGILGQTFNDMIEKRSTAEREKEKLIAELRQALEEIKKLEGLLPICAACKKIRDIEGTWTQIETFISERSEADFTHSICPDCAKKIYPEFFDQC
jgi:methyl-accepting chemotaxis protein